MDDSVEWLAYLTRHFFARYKAICIWISPARPFRPPVPQQRQHPLVQSDAVACSIGFQLPVQLLGNIPDVHVSGIQGSHGRFLSHLNNIIKRGHAEPVAAAVSSDRLAWALAGSRSLWPAVPPLGSGGIRARSDRGMCARRHRIAHGSRMEDFRSLPASLCGLVS